VLATVQLVAKLCNIMPKVSCVMPTYRRFTCVERSIACFLAQETELETELIICNTDIEHPLELDDTFSEADKSRIKSIEERKTRIMTQFNNQVENLQK
jgi:predicted class III extradiol MEMO1 family dioxygenase